MTDLLLLRVFTIICRYAMSVNEFANLIVWVLSFQQINLIQIKKTI